MLTKIVQNDQMQREREQTATPPLKSSTDAAKSRRKMAYALIVNGAVTSLCWIPYVLFVLYKIIYDLDDNEYKTTEQFSLLIGHLHSMLNPVIYWMMNYKSLTRDSCCCCPESCSCCPKSYSCSPESCLQRNPNRDLSSTNEAALGPFNPRYTRPRPQTKPTERRLSSAYLY